MKKKVLCWQLTIFGIAFFANTLVVFRHHNDLLLYKSNSKNGSASTVPICMSLGYILFGNIFDNSLKTRRIMGIIIIVLGITSILLGVLLWNNQMDLDGSKPLSDNIYSS